MYRWKQNSATVQVRPFAISVGWILALLAGYWLLADWHHLPALASAVVAFRH